MSTSFNQLVSLYISPEEYEVPVEFLLDTELRQELMVLSPGPVNLADAPLCLYVPLLWPCHPQEYLQFRVDPIQGTLGASCPFLLTSDAEQILLGSAVPAQTGPVASVEGYSRASVCAALLSLENALNQPSTRRVCPVSTNPGITTGDNSLLLAQTRSLRALSNTESRWRSVICQSLEHLRLCIGLVRLMKTAKTYRPFWQPAKRSLPLVLTPVQASLVKSGSSWPPTLVRFQQSLRFPIVFVQLFPNNEYYVVCEVIPAPLNVRFQYSLIVCAPVPDHIDVTIDAHGLAVSHTNQKLAAAGLQPTGSNLFLQVTHLVPLEVASVWFHNPSSSLSLLKSCIEKARSNALAKRTSRVAALLNRIKGGGETQTDSSDFTGGGDVTLKSNHSIVPSLSRLIGTLEENILSNCLALELSRAGITHEGVQHDADGCLSAIRLLSLPSRPLVWQPVNLVSLSDYVQQIVLRPHFDPSTHRRSWQLDLLFIGIGPSHSLNSVPVVQQKLRHQTAEWFVVRLEDYATLVKNVLAEWDCLCAMHALCYQVVTTPDFYLPPEVAVQSYNLKTLSLSYNSHYLVSSSANISFCHETGFTLALGFTPVNTPMTSSHESTVSAEVDSNPHMIIRHHLEELLNTTKSISMFAKTLVQTLPFVRAVEPLRDRTLSNHGLKTSVFYNNLRPVRGLVLIALSTYDLVLIYRACLSLRITLATPRHTLFSAFSIGTSTSSQTVQLCDAYRQLAEPTNRTGEGWVHHSGENLLSALAPLPAFQTFLNALQEAYQMDIEAESWTGLTVAQLSQLVRSSRVPVKADARHPTPCWPRPGSSPLESYLAGSLLFHASIAAIHSLDIPILTTPDYGGVEPVEPSRMTDVIQAGAFESHWSVSCLKCQLRLMPQRTGVEVAMWKLTLRLSTLLPPNSGTMDRWPQETLNLIEEFFDVRVCAAPFQPSAVTAFFRLLTLPPRAFRSVVRLLPFDLHPPAHAQVQLRLGLVALGASKRVGAQMANRVGHAMGTSPHGSVDNAGPQTPDLVPGLPGILVRPPRITLQLLISRLQQSQQRSKFPGPPMAQLLSVGYDWDANRVAILTSSSTSGGSGNSSNTLGPSTIGRSDSAQSLPQLLLESDVESNANMMASTSGESALVHLAVLITQTAYSASSGAGSAPSLGTLPAKPMYSSS
ncbi:uncharacterized protein DEA37_0006087 [Paragonimus westermani]|uniref:Mediator of RNA polymerase II transcription subunit 14 n=1 Tax=Paragonimus westermani TaxID=34504 RepID=A0A5J4NJM1_9TREM|nr:uncharacterized protein DEA37_0006087 [Paragonimus westermani]